MSAYGNQERTSNDHFNSEANILAASGDFDPAQPYTEIRMPDGRIVRLPTSSLLQAPATSGGLNGGVEGLSAIDASARVLPIIEERLEVAKRIVPTGTVRLQKTVQEYTEALDERLAVRTFDVERKVLNQPVDGPPPIRQEGSATIYSIVEEQLVLTKQLVLKEEVWIIQRDTERHDNQLVTLHREHLVVERTELD